MSAKLKAGKTLAKGIRRVVRRQLEGAVRLLKRRRKDDESIHHARTFLKQTRATLRLVRLPLGERKWSRADRRIKKIAHGLSSRRDAQVLLGTTEKLRREERPEPAASTALQQLGLCLRERLKERLQNRDRKCPSKLRAARRRVDEWPLKGLEWEDLRRGLQRTFREALKAYHAASHSRSAKDLHEWRKRMKDLWYQWKVLKSAQRGELIERAEDIKKLSALLGDDHDLYLLEDAARKAPLESRDLELILGLTQGCHEELQKRSFEIGRRFFARQPKRLQGFA